MIKLSVVVPIYNTEKYLKKCINSLLKQEIDDYEILLINDSSPDQSQNIIDEYALKYPNIIKALKKDNGGLGDTRNYGLQHAKGKYVLFVDSDDYVKEYSLNRLVEKMENQNLDILTFNFVRVDEKNKEEQTHSMDGFSVKNYILSTPNACNKMFRTALFIDNKISFPTNIWYEDLAIIPGLVKYTNKIDYLNEGIYYYLYRGDSIMNQLKYNSKILDMIESIQNLSLYLEQGYYEEMEYLSLLHLFYGSSLKLLPFHKYEELKKCLAEHEKKYPSWCKNEYFLKKPFMFKIYCLCLHNRLFYVCKILLNIRNYISLRRK